MTPSRIDSTFSIFVRRPLSASHAIRAALASVLIIASAHDAGAQIGGVGMDKDTNPPPATLNTVCSECPPPVVFPDGPGFPAIPACVEPKFEPGCLPDETSQPVGTDVVGPKGQGDPRIMDCLCWHLEIDGSPHGLRPRSCLGGGVGKACGEQPSTCNSGCLGMPPHDGDNDGIPWYEDFEGDDIPPFSDGPYKDTDFDMMPDIYDIKPLGDNANVPGWYVNPNGVLPSDASPAEIEKLINSLLHDKKISDDFHWRITPTNMDLNSDGVLTIGEVFRAIERSIDTVMDGLVADYNHGAGTLPKWAFLQGMLVTFGQANQFYSLMGKACPGIIDESIADKISDLVSGLSDDIQALIQSLDGGEHTSIEAGETTDKTGELLSGTDGGGKSKRSMIDSNGNKILPKGEHQPKQKTALSSTTGDPVNTATGEFVHETTDLAASGRGLDLALRRFYHSRSLHYGVLGHNWSMPLLETFVLWWKGSGIIEVHWGDGTQSQFRYDAQSDLYVGIGAEFSKATFGEFTDCDKTTQGPGITVRQQDGTQYLFCPPNWSLGMGGQAVGWLRKVTDPYGNAIVLKRHAWGGVRELIDTLGRSVQFTYEQGDAAGEYRLKTISAPWMSRTVTYTYDTEKGDLLRADYPQEVIVDATGHAQVGDRFEAYAYDELPGGWQANKGWILNHNLVSIRHSSATPTVTVEYHKPTPQQMKDPALAYTFDRVKSHANDGHVTQYAYQSITPTPGQDPYDDSISPKITHVTSTLSGAGTIQRFLHGDGLLHRHEIFNGYYDSSWQFVGGLYQSPDDPVPHNKWMKLYSYDTDQRLTRVLDTTDVLFPNGRSTSYAYNTQSSDKFQQGKPIQIVEQGYPGSEQRTTVIAYDPITSKLRSITDPLGRTTTVTFGHQELSYANALTLDTVAGWGILPQLPTQYGSLFGLGDVNADSTLGGNSELIRLELPELTVEAAAGPGNPTVVRPSTLRKYNAFGLISSERDERGVWTKIARAYAASTVAEKKTVVGPSQNVVLTDTVAGRGDPIERALADGRLMKTDYTSTGQPTVLRIRPAASDSGYSVSDGSVVPPVVTGDHETTDTQDVVLRIYYDAQGRPVGSTLPRYLSSNQDAAYAGTPNPPFESRTTYDSRDNPVTVVRTVYGDDGAPIITGTYTNTYDGDGRLDTAVLPSGASIQSEYDARGLIIRRTRRDENGVVRGITQFDYDPLGSQIREIDANGLITTFVHDGFGQERERHLPTGAAIYTTLDSADRVLLEETKVGATLLTSTAYEYDSSNRVTRVTRAHNRLNADGTVTPLTPANVVERMGWGIGETDQLWTLKDEGGIGELHRYEYDWQGRLIREIEGGAAFVRKETTYDVGGRPLTLTTFNDGDGNPGPISPSASVRKFGYDRHRRQRIEIDPLGRVTQTFRTIKDIPGLVADAAGKRDSYHVDSEGRTRQHAEIAADGTSRTTNYRYDIEGNWTSCVDALGRRTDFTYDCFSRRTARKFPDTSVEVTTYDDGDRVDLITLPGSVTWDHQYGPTGRLDAIVATGADASVARTFAYDGLNHAISIAENVAGQPPVTVKRLYSSVDQLVEDKLQRASAPAAGFSMVYDARGLLKQVFYPSGLRVNRLTSSVGHLLTIGSNMTGTLATVAQPYGEAGYRRLDLANGATLAQDYDANGKVLGRTVRTAGQAVLAGLSTTYDLVGNPLSRTRASDNRVEELIPDKFSRLETWNILGPSGPTRTRHWTWDNVDNPELVTDTLLGGADGAFNELNQLTANTPQIASLTYSPRGDETARVAGGQTLDWQWDAFGRPISAEYDAGTGIGLIQWYHDSLDRVVERRTSAGRVTTYDYVDSVLHRSVDSIVGASDYIQGPSGTHPFYRWRNPVDHAYLHVDVFGNVEAIHTGTQLIAAFDYEPFGLPRDRATGAVVTAASDCELLFGGRLYDPDAKLSLLGVRRYDPTLERFVSRDPGGENAGLNLYAYARGNPLRWSDFTGFSPDEIGGPDESPKQRSSAFRGRPELVLVNNLQAVMNDWLDFLGTDTQQEMGVTGHYESMDANQKMTTLLSWINGASWRVEGIPGGADLRNEVALELEDQHRQLIHEQFFNKCVTAAGVTVDLTGSVVEAAADAAGVDPTVAGIAATLANVPVGAAKKGARFIAGKVASNLVVDYATSKARMKLAQKLLDQAKKQYPKKAGKDEWHHVIPIYVGGAKAGDRILLNGAYHQLITNEFRAQWPYGGGRPSFDKLQEILDVVYKKYPLVK